jgi:hypothetical protein
MRSSWLKGAEPERELLVEHEVVRVVADAPLAHEADAGVDPRPALLGRVRHDRDVVGHVVAVERPHLGEARLQLRDQVGVRHDLVEQPVLLLDRDLDPQVVDDQAAQRADRGA